MPTSAVMRYTFPKNLRGLPWCISVVERQKNPLGMDKFTEFYEVEMWTRIFKTS